MNPVAAQQVAFDNALVAPKKRLRIKKCNARIEFSKPQRETTYQVTLDALKLSPCYLAFLITTEVPKICPRLPNQDFVEPPPEEEMVPFNKELGYTGKCDMLSEIHIDHIHQPWRTFAAIINKCIFGKSTGLDSLRPSRAQILWGMFNLGMSTLGDTHGVFVLKKKAPTKVDRGKGMDLISEAALLEVAQLKKTLKKSKQETHKLHASGLGNSEDDDNNDDESDDVSNDDDDVYSDADGDNEASDSEKTDFNEDKNPNLNQNDDDDEEYEEEEEEYVHTPNNYEFTNDEEEYEELYKDVNVRLRDVEHGEEGKEDAKKSDAGTKETTYEQVKDDEHKYGALIPKEMINQAIKDSKAYKIYLDFATGKSTPKKASKFKKVDSPSKKLSHVLEEEPAKKPKQANKSVKESTTVPTACVVIRDTPGVFVSKKKAPAKVDRGKCIDLLYDVALLEATQLKKALKKSKQETHKLHASGLGDGVGSQPKVPDESQNKITGINERTCTIPGIPDVPKYQSESKNESWGDSEDDNSNDDDSDDVTNDDDDVDSDADVDNEVSDSEKADSDEDENPNLNQNDDEEKEYEEEYVRTPDNYEFSNDDEEYEELYKDVNVRLKDAKHEEKVKGDAKMTDAGRDDVSQEKSYEQVKDDAHVTLTAAHVTQKTKGPMQSSSVSFDFASQFLNLDNFPPVDNEVVSMMNVKVRHEESSTQTPSFLTIHVMVILETSTAAVPTIPLIIPPITPIPQQSTPTPTLAPTTEMTTTSIPALLDFSSLFGFDQRSQIPAMVDAQLSTRLEDSIQKAYRSYTAEFEKKAQVSDYATPVIQSTITESLENVILAKSSSQPKYTYEAASSLTEFEWKKILLDKKQKSKSY
ncbi:hypothetical protein Tco_0324662 [Tanacetum coccineum]